MTTPDNPFEEAYTSLGHVERLLGEAETVEEFNEATETSNGASQHHAPFWEPEHFSRAKNCLGEDGEGLGG